MFIALTLYVTIYTQYLCFIHSYLHRLFSTSIAGLFYYVMLLVTLLWLFHILMLSWGVIWPWHHQAYHTSGRMKYIHLTIVATSLVLPIISILACQWSEGFGLSILSYYKCEGRGSKDSFFAVTMPVDIMIIIGTSVLLYTIWIIADMVSVNLHSL